MCLYDFKLRDALEEHVFLAGEIPGNRGSRPWSAPTVGGAARSKSIVSGWIVGISLNFPILRTCAQVKAYCRVIVWSGESQQIDRLSGPELTDPPAGGGT